MRSQTMIHTGQGHFREAQKVNRVRLYSVTRREGYTLLHFTSGSLALYVPSEQLKHS